LKNLLLSLVIAGAAQLASAQEYPTKPVRVIVPFSAGAPIDILFRIISPKLYESMGQAFIADNRPGGAGWMATDAAARAAPDGYTLYIAAVGQLVQTPILHGKTLFNPSKEFAPIGQVCTGPLVFALHPSLPVKSVKDLVALAKRRPGQLNYATGGVGDLNHLLGEMFRLLTGTNIVHVPYKGGGDAVSSVLGGETDMVISGVPPLIAHAKAGKLRVIVTSGRNRIPNLPEVPTMAEAGFPDAEVVVWYGLFAPAATPKRIIDRLNREIVNVMNLPDVRQRYSEQGVDPESNSPEQFAQMIRDDYARWSKIIPATGIKVE
jgi:tripartite-type tricarboxylate transporter receptor subunit TctC